jgi:hypothetical protein
MASSPDVFRPSTPLAVKTWMTATSVDKRGHDESRMD